MQQKVSTVKPRYLKGKNYRIRELKSGELQIEIRSTEYGYETKRLPKGTTPTDAHKRARNMLQEMANADAPELARKVLRQFTLDRLIEAYIKLNTDRGERDGQNLRTFQKYKPETCANISSYEGR